MNPNILEIVVFPKPELSKNGMAKIAYLPQDAQKWAVNKTKKMKGEERQNGMFLAMQEMQINGSWDGSLPVTISIEHFYSNKPYDQDGLMMACAPYIDGFVDAGVMVDDNPNTLKSYTAKFTKVKTRAENKTVITVSQVTSGGS